MAINVLVPVWRKQAWLVPIFWKHFVLAWPDCPYPVITLISDKPWATQMMEYLQPNQPPFLLLLSDYILQSVDRRLMQKAAEAIERNGVGFVRVEPVPPPTLPWSYDKDLGRINPREKYVVSLQPAFWKAGLLKSVLMPGETPWQIEQRGNKRLYGYTEHNLLGTKKPALKFLNYLHRGEPEPDAVRWVKEFKQ